MTRALEGVKLGLLVLVTAVLQASIVGAFDIGGGRPDLLLVSVVAVALLRGTTTGAVVGFAAGIVFDLATFETLGVTSLLLTLAGYWIGRYGETTGRGRQHAHLLSVLVITIAYAVGGYALHTILGDTVSAKVALGTALLPALVGNLLLTVPVFALVRRLLTTTEREGLREVRLLG